MSCQRHICKLFNRVTGILFLKKRGLRGGPTAAFHYLKGAYQKDGERLFAKVCPDSLRDNGFELEKRRLRSDVGKEFCTMRVTEHWDGLPGEVAGALSPLPPAT